MNTNCFSISTGIAVSSHGISESPTKAEGFHFQKVFTEGDFMGSGILELCEGGQKPPKASKENAMLFIIMQGAAEITIFNTVFQLNSGGQFLVPRGKNYTSRVCFSLTNVGNHYSIRNIYKGTTKMYFVQATDTLSNRNHFEEDNS